jgi:hypothetical protein
MKNPLDGSCRESAEVTSCPAGFLSFLDASKTRVKIIKQKATTKSFSAPFSACQNFVS